MSKSLISLAVAAAALAAPAPALAQAKPAAQPAAQPTRAGLTSDLQARFKIIDVNGDKSLDKAEIDTVNARIAKQTEAALSKRLENEFAQLDTNKDKQLSLAEFKAAAPSAEPTPSDATIQQFDSDKDKKVSFAEFSASMLGTFDRVDSNKDGTLSTQEQQAARQRR